MIPGMNPRMMKDAMKRMGIKQQEIDVSEVIIRTPEKEIIFSNPNVSKINMMGQDSWQIVGNYEEISIEKKLDISEDDIKTVMEQTNVDEETARKVIERNNGDLASAIMELKKE